MVWDSVRVVMTLAGHRDEAHGYKGVTVPRRALSAAHHATG
ncbi:MAG TPA: hypothetical protein VLS44_02090 [Nitrospira sp.]|nr:hypothetical protein [Nitrospira sp.]